MYRYVKIFVVVLCLGALIFTLAPSQADATIESYQESLVYKADSSQEYAYALRASDTLSQAEDPLLVDIENSVGTWTGYLFLSNNKEVVDVAHTRQTDSFPQRLMGGYSQSVYGHKDHTQATSYGFHQGTDLSTLEPYRTNPIYHVALWGGTVEEVRTKPGAGGKGLYVVINHGNNFYTRYQHLASVLVKAGDSVNAGDIVGTMGGSGATSMNNYSRHAHVELILWNQKWNNSKQGQFYYGGVANLLWEGKRLDQISWYKGPWRGSITDTKASGSDYGSDLSPY